MGSGGWRVQRYGRAGGAACRLIGVRVALRMLAVALLCTKTSSQRDARTTLGTQPRRRAGTTLYHRLRQHVLRPAAKLPRVLARRNRRPNR